MLFCNVCLQLFMYIYVATVATSTRRKKAHLNEYLLTKK